ncbi:MAG: outer membrane beta-barrel protein [Rhodomicrobium sp.]
MAVDGNLLAGGGYKDGPAPSHFVFGIEADLQGSGIDGSGSATAIAMGDDIPIIKSTVATASAKTSLDWFGSVRGTFGYAYDNTLFYFTGGLAFGGIKDRLSLTVSDAEETSSVFSKTAQKSDTRVGYALGGGIEYLVNPKVSIKGEYQYIDLGSTSLSESGSVYTGDGNGYASGSGSAHLDHTYHTVRLGLNYHFDRGYEPLSA